MCVIDSKLRKSILQSIHIYEQKNNESKILIDPDPQKKMKIKFHTRHDRIFFLLFFDDDESLIVKIDLFENEIILLVVVAVVVVMIVASDINQ